MKPPVLSDEELLSWHLGRLKSRQGIAKAQRDDTYQKMLKWFVEWGESDCPHQHLTPDSSTAYQPLDFTPWAKRQCDKCWQEFQKLAEGYAHSWLQEGGVR